nr:hypothetical protein [Tanacetum cinerariifolium]
MSKVNKNFEALALISQALEDESWVDVMQEEFVVLNSEGIDYDEVFAHVVKLEAIKIFLAFASYMGFIVYQMDVKSAFLYGTINEEVYVSQPPGFVDPKFPNKEKSRYRRRDIMLVQVYVDDIIFGSTKKSWCDEFEELTKNSVKTASTPIKTQKPLVKDKEAVDVDVHIYRPNGQALRKCFLSGPYKPTTVLVQVIEATNDSLAILEHTTVETPMNMSPKNKAYFLAEKEAIHLILTGIGDIIYSTVDACQTTQEIWEAIERLQQEWSRFVTIVKQQHKLDEVSYHKLFNILKQYQNEVSELHAERLVRNANPLALVATAQANQDPYYQTSRSHRSQAPSSKPLIPTRSHTTTRHKGKEIAKPITPPSEIASEEDIDPEQSQRDKDMQKNLALIAKEFRHFAKECIKPKRVKDSSYHKEKMLLCKLAEQGVLLQAEHYMAKIQEVPTADSGIDSEPVELTNQTEFEKYKAFNDRTIDYDKLERKLNEALGPLAQKDTIIKEGLKTKAYELSVVKEKQDELIKQSLLTKLHYEGIVKKKTKVITDSKLKEEHDIEKMLSMEKQLKFLNEIIYKRSQSIQTIQMMAPKGVLIDFGATMSNSLKGLKCVARPKCFLNHTIGGFSCVNSMYLHKVKECDCLAQKLLKQTESVSKKIVKLILFIVDSGCMKYMTGNLKLLRSNPQDKQPSMNIPSTSAPSTPTNVHAKENNDNQAEEGEQLQDDEFTNPFCALTQEEAKSSSHNICNSNEIFHDLKKCSQIMLVLPQFLQQFFLGFRLDDLLFFCSSRSSLKLSRDQTSNSTSSNFEENPLPPVPMAENQTMAQLLQAPTDRYEDAIVIPEIAATNFKLKHGLINLVQNKQFFRHEKEDPHAHLRYFNKITSTIRFVKHEPRQSLPSGNVYQDNIQEYMSQAAAATYGQGNTGFRPQMVANQIRPPGFLPVQNTQNNFNRGNNFNQNRGGNFNQSNFNQNQLNRPQVNQPLAYQAPAYQALVSQTQSVSQNDFERYIKANDAVLRNIQNQGQSTQTRCQNTQNQLQTVQNQLSNLTDMMSKFMSANTASSSGSGTLPGNTVTNPKEDLKGINTRSGVAYQGPTMPTPSKVAKQGTEVTKD